MIFDTDVMTWAFRGNAKALDAIDEATTRSISSVTYMGEPCRQMCASPYNSDCQSLGA